MPCRPYSCDKTVRSKHKRVPPHNAKACLGQIKRGPGGTYRAVRRVNSNGKVSHRWERFKSRTIRGRTECNKKNFMACKKGCKWRRGTAKRRGYCMSATRRRKRKATVKSLQKSFQRASKDEELVLEIADFADKTAALLKKTKVVLKKQKKKAKKSAAKARREYLTRGKKKARGRVLRSGRVVSR